MKTLKLKVYNDVTSCSCLRIVRKSDPGFASFCCGIDFIGNQWIANSPEVYGFSLKRVVENVINYKILSRDCCLHLDDILELRVCDDTQALVSYDDEMSCEEYDALLSEKQSKGREERDRCRFTFHDLKQDEYGNYIGFIDVDDKY